jgi:hypothetical protein
MMENDDCSWKSYTTLKNEDLGYIITLQENSFTDVFKKG